MLILEEFSSMTKQEVKEKLLSQEPFCLLMNRNPSVEFEKKDDMETALTKGTQDLFKFYLFLPADELSEPEKAEINRVSAIEEIVTTEIGYVADLQIIINVTYSRKYPDLLFFRCSTSH
jgi:hypothetical protein